MDEGTPTVGDAEAAELSQSGALPPVQISVHEGAGELRRLGRFVLLQQLGAGGMGTVYTAYDEKLDRKVAIKLLHGKLTPAQQRYTLREAQAMARVAHPNVVSVYDVGEVEDQIFIAMERVEGVSLARWQRRDPPHTWTEILITYIQAGEGLQAVHLAGMVHRDFKPENVLMGSDGRPRVTDFGIAYFESLPADPLAALSGSHPVAEPTPPVPAAPSVVGTPGYMSPEQCKGAKIDARSDQFSFCAALYQALYGELPFAGMSLKEEIENTIAGRLRPHPAPGRIPEEIYAILKRGLSVLPEERYPSMGELLTALGEEIGHSSSGAGLARRRYGTLIVPGIILLTIVRELTVDSQRRTLRGALITSIAMLGLHLGLGVLMRKSLLRNDFHKRLYLCLTLLVGTLAGMCAVAVYENVPTYQFFAVDMIGLAGFVAVLALLFLPALWGMVPLLLAGGATVAHFGAAAARIGPVLITMTACAIIVSWERVAIRRTKRKDGLADPSSSSSTLRAITFGSTNSQKFSSSNSQRISPSNSQKFPAATTSKSSRRSFFRRSL